MTEIDEIDRMHNLPRSKAVCAAMTHPAEHFEPPAPGEDVTEKIQASLSWMAMDMDYRRGQSGLDADPLSPEMQTVHGLLEDFEAGRIQCVRREQ